MDDIQYIEGTRCINLIGKKFNMLAVDSLAYVRKYNEAKLKNKAYWNCKCDCLNIKSVREDNLIKGKSYSCGYYNKESWNIPKMMREIMFFQLMIFILMIIPIFIWECILLEHQ